MKIRKIKLRRARISDLCSVLAIEKEAFPTPWSENSFRQELSGRGRYFWILEKDGEVVGYICFWVWGEEMQVANLAIKKEYRGQRLGEYLLRQALRLSSKKGAKTAFLEVREKNLPARKLYQRLGFQSIGRRTKYYLDTGEDALILALSLTK